MFENGNIIHPYALGGIISDILMRPTLFPMANGAGLAGEAGPEAIMPLKRGSDGRLGVSGDGGGDAVTMNNNFSVNYAGSPPSDPQELAAHAMAMRRQFEGMMNDWALKQQRPGGILPRNN